MFILSVCPTVPITGKFTGGFNLGQVYGALNDVEKATGAFATTYRLSQNRAKTEQFMRQALTTPENNETTHVALQQALKLFGLPEYPQ